MTTNSYAQLLMLEAHGPDGHVWRFYADGRVEGFPEGTKIINHALKHLNLLQHQIFTATAANVPPVGVDGRNLSGALNPGMVPSKTDLRMYSYKPGGS